MDSGNSGSLQSSSGGDDEYDSRNESISAFLNSSSSHLGVLGNPRQPPPPSSLHQHHQNPNNPTSLFDPLSNYFDVFSSSRSTPPPNPNSPLNLDMVWSRNLRSEPNLTDMGALMGSSSSIMGSTDQDVNRVAIQTPPSSMPFPQVADTSVRATASSSDPTNVARTSKKRSRASRRAPTTVLTTDTSNFRAMVQEFTGIPAPPFSASPFPRSRLDLFNTASTMRSGHLEPIRPPPYLLRPFAQKPSPFASSAVSPGIASTNNMSTTSTTSSNNYQLLSELGLSKQSQNLVNMQNPLLTFQSLLQCTMPPKYPLPNSSGFGDNSQGILSNTRMGTLEEFNMNHGQVRTHLNELPNFGTSEGMRNISNLASNCGDGVGSNDGDDQGQARSFNENYGNSQRANSCKLNFSGSSSHEKGTENVSSRGGEGMMDSWICSSD